MSVGKKILFGSLGWVLGGPIGAIIGYYLASSGDQAERSHFSQTASGIYPSTKPGDFMVSLMVLVPSATQFRAIIWACKSVGNPG